MRKGAVVVITLLSFSVNALPARLHTLTSHENFGERVKQWFGFAKSKIIETQVIDAITSTPIENALVIANNLSAYTDKNGFASFETSSDVTLAITAAKPTYNAYTVFGIEKGHLTIPLVSLTQKENKAKLTGQFKGWPKIVNGDDKIDVGLIVPFIQLSQLLDFNFGSLFGPPTKGIAYEERDIPGNIVLPKQKEYYLRFISVPFEHPVYTLELEKNKTHNLAAIIGQVPFSTAASTFMSGGSLENVLNTLQFTKLEIVNNLPIKQDQTLDITLNRDLLPNLTVMMENVPPNRGVIAVSAGNLDGEAQEFFPTSFKMISKSRKEKRADLATIQAFREALNFVVAIAADLPERTDDKGPFDSAASGIIQHDKGQGFWKNTLTLNTFLKLINLNASEDLKNFEFSDATNPSISPQPTMAISQINHIIDSDKNMTASQVINLWTIVTPAHKRNFTLPDIPFYNELIPDPKTTPEKDKVVWKVGSYAFQSPKKNLNYHEIDDTNFRMHVSHFSRNLKVLKE